LRFCFRVRRFAFANEEAKITTRSYHIGRHNYETAVKEELGLPASAMNPVTSAASPVIGAENAAGSIHIIYRLSPEAMFRPPMSEQRRKDVRFSRRIPDRT